MRFLRAVGRALRAIALGLWRGTAFAGRALGRGGRALGRGGRALGRGVAWAAGWRQEQSEEVRRRRALALQVLAWSVAVIVAFIAFATAGSTFDTERIGYGLMPFVGAIVGLPLGLIGTRPLLALMVSVGAAFVLGLTLPLRGDPDWHWLVVHGLVIFALLFATCARESFARASGGWLVTAALFAWGSQPGLRTGWVVGITSIAVIGLLAGRLASTSKELVRQEEVTAAEQARRVVLEERARIARDLHDIVAHHMSLVVVQAETAPYRVPDVSDGAVAEFLSIGEAARSALTETRALLSVLRQEDQPEHAPQPGIEQVAELVERARRAGLNVEARVAGDLAKLRPGASLAAYRIAQEALANAARHGGGAPVRLELNSSASGVRLLVLNGAPAEPVKPSAGPGHGITGMRERAAAAGGELKVGPAGEGFAVELHLPAEYPAGPPVGPSAGPPVGPPTEVLSPRDPQTGAAR